MKLSDYERILAAAASLSHAHLISLITRAILDDAESIRRLGLRLFQKFDVPQVIPYLISLSRDPSVYVKRELADVLAKYNTHRSVRLLRRLAHDSDHPTRRQAILSLGQLGDGHASNLAWHEVRHGRNWLTKCDALEVLAILGKRRHIPAIRRCLKRSRVEYVRLYAACALSQLRDHGSSKVFYQLIRSSNERDRLAGWAGLYGLGQRESLFRLDAFLYSKSPVIQGSAANVLVNIIRDRDRERACRMLTVALRAELRDSRKSWLREAIRNLAQDSENI